MLDIMDMWTETLPIGNIKKYFPFSFWKQIRDKSIKFADYVITECELYNEKLKKHYSDTKHKTVYLTKSEKSRFLITNSKVRYQPRMNQINFLYLGSINNIIDSDFIKEILIHVSKYKNVSLSIIGSGEKKSYFIDLIIRSGIEVIDYGTVYDELEKLKIIESCDFGINLMKQKVLVGLTMKSIDYFYFGLPIINNIPADTSRLVQKYKAGYNIYCQQDIPKIVDRIRFLKEDDYKKLHFSALNLYNCELSNKIFNSKLNEIYEEIFSYEK